MDIMTPHLKEGEVNVRSHVEAEHKIPGVAHEGVTDKRKQNKPQPVESRAAENISGAGVVHNV